MLLIILCRSLSTGPHKYKRQSPHAKKKKISRYSMFFTSKFRDNDEPDVMVCDGLFDGLKECKINLIKD